MEHVEKIREQIITFNEQVGWGKLTPESANHIASLLIGEAVELWEEINMENKSGLNKYDVSLEIADVYIYLQKICIALDIDLLTAVEDKMLINRARFLNDDYRNKVIRPKPKAERYYKIDNMYSTLAVKDSEDLIKGQILGIKNDNNQIQEVYIVDEQKHKPQYMKKIIAIVYPRNDRQPLWVASNQQLTVDEVDHLFRSVDFLYDIELVK